jgi:hypothetical protein
MMKVILFRFLLISCLYGSFIEKYYLPKGVYDQLGQICIADVDRDNHYEFIFRSFVDGINATYFCKFILPDSWQIDIMIYWFAVQHRIIMG